MKEKIIYIPIYLNTHSWKQNDKERFTKEWLDYRIDIFMKYTLQSLKAQTNQDFMATIIYEDITENIIKEILLNYDKLPNNINFIKKSESNSYMLKAIKGYDYLYLVRLDSDDMYDKYHIQKLHEYKPKETTLVLLSQNGYIYDAIGKRLGRCYYVSPPFYTLIYKVKDYLSKIRYKLIGGHSGAIKLPNEIIDSKYIWNCHSMNTAMSDFKSRMGRVGRGDIITDSSEVRRILSEFIENI